MNILITNIQLTVPGGTVSYVNDLATGLKKRGFRVEIYTAKVGLVGNDLIQAGFNVVTNLGNLKNIPNLIHSHHNPVTMDVLMKFKNTPVVFFLHDKTSPFDHPIKHPNIVKHVAVDYNCLDRLLYKGKIDKKHAAVIYNWVDTGRFKIRTTFNDKPLKALVFSNYATKNNYYKIIERACTMAGLQLTAIGSGMGNAVKNPEEILGQYDLVFAKAKAAIEALATGAGVILCDYGGLGEMVNQSNIAYLRKYNFGRKTLTRPIDTTAIATEISKFNSNENRLNAHTISKEASFEKTLDVLVDFYKTAVAAYANGERGPDGNLALQKIRSYSYKYYFYFTGTTLFKILSSLKYKLKNLFVK